MSSPAHMVGVRCYHTSAGGGNLHLVILPVATCWSPQRACELSRRIAPVIVVLVRQVPAGGFALSFHCNGQAIARCGSGTVAAARALLNSDRGVRTPLHFDTVAGAVQVVSGAGELLGYRIDTLPYRDGGGQRCWQGVINRGISNVVLIGNSRDYCLVELRDPAALRRCRINVGRLSLLSQRALIVTARSRDAVCDYYLRYFSPQYGQYEDAATGSAHAMAAAYWQRRIAGPRLRGMQLSAAGGEFLVQRVGLLQCVFGRADIVAPFISSTTVTQCMDAGNRIADKLFEKLQAMEV